ncbi:MAG: histidine--tRNA ligase [Promethearchaeota archaeon]
MTDTKEKLNLQSPSGTLDYLPEEMEKYKWVRNKLETVFQQYGYQQIELPMYEFFDIYRKRSGEKVINDIFTFYDPPKHRAAENPPLYALRPEFTASLARFYITSELMYRPKPQKYYYIGPCFRYDEPAPGRYRQFTQAGLEIFGPDTATSDAEMLIVAMDVMENFKIKDYLLRINDLTILRSYLEDLQYDEKQQRQIFGIIDRITSLLRKLEIGALDEKDSEISIIDDYYGSMSEAGFNREVTEKLENLLHLVGQPADILPKLKQFFADNPGPTKALEDSKLAEVCTLIETAEVSPFVIDCGIARGLDYYTNIVFEIDVPILGKQKQICGGGRYNEMIQAFGGEDTPGLGFSFGFDRILIALERQGLTPEVSPRSDLFIGTKAETRGFGMAMARKLRAHGIRVEVDLMNRSFKSAGKFVNRVKIPYMMFLGPRELESNKFTLKDFRTQEQNNELDFDSLLNFLAEGLNLKLD